ncbi:hypothetical protein [Bacteroides fragilis]|nr:hypothetical protein [Bacteroides fragilis]
MKENVKVWEEDILLPTYGIGRPERTRCFWKSVSIKAAERQVRYR